MSHPLRTIEVMVMRGHWVRYGTEAAVALRDEIRAAKGSEPLAPVTVVVPSNQVGVSARRQLASGALGPVCGSGPGLIGVSFLTPYRLAELVGAAALAGTGRRPVSTPVITAAVRAALTEDPGLFASVAQHPATEAALVATYRELRDVSKGSLDALARQGVRPADVVRLHRATRARLAPSWSDEEDLLSAAVGVLQDKGAAHLGTVVVHLPQRLSGHAAGLLRTVAASTPVVVLAGSTGSSRADAEVASSVARLGVELAPASVGTVSFGDGGSLGVSAENTRVVTASDADEEVRAAVRLVIEAVRRGTALDRIAILHASADPYGRLVHEHLGAAGIAANGTAEVPVAGRLAGRALLQLLELADLGFRRKDVFAWLAAAPILHEGRWAPVTAWERLSRDAGVVGGRDGWDRLLGNLAHRLQADAAAALADPERPRWQSDKWEADGKRVRQLQVFVLSLIARLDRAATQPQAWSEWGRWARWLLDELLGGAGRRETWPEVERKAAERVELALDRLGALDDVEGAVGLDVFTRTLAIELESDLGRVGRFGEGVLVGSVGLAVGLDLDLVVLLGLAEGTFPSPVRDDSLLPDAERKATGRELALRSEHVDRLHHQFLAALAGASRHVLGVPRGDLRRSSQRVPSRWVLDVASSLAGKRWWSAELLGSGVPWVHHVASFDAGVRQTVFPATAQEHRLRSLLATAVPRHDLHGVAAGIDPVLGAGVTSLDARSSTAFTRFDGNLAGLTIASPVTTGTSATSLQRWAECPHAYFLQNLLGVQPIEQPEDLLQMSPLDKGSLVHDILERFIEEVISRPIADQPEPGEPWSSADQACMVGIAQQLCDEYEARGLTGRAIFWRRDRAHLLRELHRFLDEDDGERRRTGTRPVAAELAFGLSERHGCRLPAVLFPLPDGRCVPMRGKADRVDLGDDGTIHVVDYKTGKDDDYKKLSEVDPHQHGTLLQLAVYGQAARSHLGHPDATVEATYWFVSTRGNFQRRGYRVTSEVLGRVGQAMHTIVSGIERGVFAAHPPEAPSTSPWVDCRFCDPDGLGTAELRRQWARMADDPDLASYLELTEPIVPVEAS